MDAITFDLNPEAQACLPSLSPLLPHLLWRQPLLVLVKWVVRLVTLLGCTPGCPLRGSPLSGNVSRLLSPGGPQVVVFVAESCLGPWSLLPAVCCPSSAVQCADLCLYFCPLFFLRLISFRFWLYRVKSPLTALHSQTSQHSLLGQPRLWSVFTYSCRFDVS